MNKRTILLTVLAFAFASISCQPPAQQMAPGTPSDEDVAAIRNANQAFVQAHLAGDWTAAVAVLTEDAVWMPPNQPVREGRAAIQEWLSPLTVTDFEVTPFEMGGHGGFAYRRGRYSITLTVEGTEGSVSDTGKYVEIWRKELDGSWLIDQAIWNSDLPLAARSVPASRDADVEAIRQADLAWSAAQASDGLDGVMPFYVDDAILLPPDSPMAIGKEAIREASAKIDSPGFSVSWKPMKVEVAQSGELGYAIGNAEGNSVDSAGNLVPVKGKYVEIWKKQADGSWKVAVDMFSSDSLSGPIF